MVLFLCNLFFFFVFSHRSSCVCSFNLIFLYSLIFVYFIFPLCTVTGEQNLAQEFPSKFYLNLSWWSYFYILWSWIIFGSTVCDLWVVSTEKQWKMLCWTMHVVTFRLLGDFFLNLTYHMILNILIMYQFFSLTTHLQLIEHYTHMEKTLDSEGGGGGCLFCLVVNPALQNSPDQYLQHLWFSWKYLSLTG